MMHVKDEILAKEGKRNMRAPSWAWVSLVLKKFVISERPGGTKWFIVEQESTRA
jgi:hypothetical protein